MNDDAHHPASSTLPPPQTPRSGADDFDAVVEFFCTRQGKLLAPTSLPMEASVARAVYPKGFGDVVLAAEVAEVELPTPTPEDKKKAHILRHKLIKSDRSPFIKKVAKKPR